MTYTNRETQIEKERRWINEQRYRERCLKRDGEK